MAGYIGTKAVLLSTTAATVTGDMTVGGAATISGAATFSGPFTSLGIDDNAAATAVTIDASGNVGIGTAAPTFSSGAFVGLHIHSQNGTALRLTNFGQGQLATDGFDIQHDSGGDTFFVNRDSGNLRHYTGGTERMRITTAGEVLVGTTASYSGNYRMSIAPDIGTGFIIYKAATTANHVAASFQSSSGSTVGAIHFSSSATSYNTSSDYRLKENITPVQGAADIVKAMRPCTYTFKSDGSWHDGFLAHELQELHPRAVTGSKDAMRDEEYEVTPAVLDEDGNVVTEAVMGTRSVPDYQGVDYSKLTPILTAALQEALNKIDALEARLTALEAV